nr:uncharacterized protein LOC108178570 isoform X2 [Oryctolagus cuniculus]
MTAGHLCSSRAAQGRGQWSESTPRHTQAASEREARKPTAALTCCWRRSMGTWSGSGGHRSMEDPVVGKSEGAKTNQNSQDPACRRREGCALARAPVRSAISWALLRRSMRCRPSWFRPPAAADQSQRGAAPGRGGCYTRGWPSCPRSEPAAASSSSSSSTLGAGSRSRAGAGEEEVAAQLGQQQMAKDLPTVVPGGRSAPLTPFQVISSI